MSADPDQQDTLIFDIGSIEGEYGERSPFASEGRMDEGAARQAGRGGILRLPAPDGELIFIEL